MKQSAFLFLMFLFLSCENTVEEDDLTLLNGYWEITEVQFMNGGKKEYKISPAVDYIQLENLKGYRKKVNPKFDGSFETSDDAEPFVIQKDGALFLMNYKNNLSEWKETLIDVSENSFSVKNAEGTLYLYKRFEPINIEP
ncbi:hypothetical protein BFP77_04970 [Maribacter sp. 4U21]|uniref:hypothetical protein n=1 Tax=Maribacter sp. 4U21 TaxID=1889779 RepID=UPI000C14A22F|nr:hypothetical protein [Maribacter sp. 4U21]PIB29977.1 hypothetical protein BFP77_04970 [Maribacter sp. 4U21]